MSWHYSGKGQAFSLYLAPTEPTTAVDVDLTQEDYMETSRPSNSIPTSPGASCFVGAASNMPTYQLGPTSSATQVGEHSNLHNFKSAATSSAIQR